jgi:hypothetical protein
VLRAKLHSPRPKNTEVGECTTAFLSKPGRPLQDVPWKYLIPRTRHANLRPHSPSDSKSAPGHESITDIYSPFSTPRCYCLGGELCDSVQPTREGPPRVPGQKANLPINGGEAARPVSSSGGPRRPTATPRSGWVTEMSQDTAGPGVCHAQGEAETRLRMRSPGTAQGDRPVPVREPLSPRHADYNMTLGG